MRKILTICLLLCFVSCSGNHSSKEVADHREQRYILETDEPIPMAILILHPDNNTFVFSHDITDSTVPNGKYEIEDNVLILIVDEDSKEYYFDIIDENTLQFSQFKSDQIELLGHRVVLSDGSRFILDIHD